MGRSTRRIYSLILLFFILGVPAKISSVESKPSIATLTLTKDDKILILAPHPDDEVLACGGVIQEAVRIGAKVKILYLTKGEHNPISLITYKKNFLFKNIHKEFIQLGKIRKRESIEATGALGIENSQLIFLAYPDSGIRSIFTDHWGEGNNYKDFLTGLSQSVEGEGLISNAPYIGEAILGEIEKVIKDFKPTKIFSSHPLDQHSDHIALYLFLKTALLELQEDIPKPEIYLYIVHFSKWPVPRGLHSDKMFLPPEGLNNLDLNYFIYELKSNQIERKKQAIMKFKSQIKYSRNYLLSFVRANEIFSGDLEDIYLGNDFNYTVKGKRKIKDISFYCKDNKLNIDINLSKHIYNKNISGMLYLFGYQNKKAFKDMPKIKIGFRQNRWSVYNLKHKISKQDANFKFKASRLHFSIPLSLLGNPDFIFYSLKSNLSSWNCWRMIRVNR